jgi:two-component sensor histidine kinase
LLIRRGWSQIPVAELVDAQLAFLGKDTLEHVTVVAGPDFEVSPRSAEIIGMALHELATNALKYGALSVSEGVAEVGWMVRGEKLGLWWVECNGPPVTPPDKRGFGSTVMRDIPTRSLKADVRLEFREEGVAWQLECDAETAAQL